MTAVYSSRSVFSKILLSALSLMFCGGGLFRIGKPVYGILFFIYGQLSFAAYRIFACRDFGLGPRLSIAIPAFALATGLILAVGSAILTWRLSGRTDPQTQSGSRFVVVGMVVLNLMVGATIRASGVVPVPKTFAVKSDSMAPGLMRGDAFIVDRSWHGPFERGMTIIYTTGQAPWVRRVVGLPGDFISIRAGVPFVNRRAATQEAFLGDGADKAVFTEQLPGETGTHLIRRDGQSPYGDMDEVIVPQGCLFLLGDNRDNAVDSRIRVQDGGLGMVPFSRFGGKLSMIYWSPNWSKVGTWLN